MRLAGLWKLEEVSLSRAPYCPLPELPSLLASLVPHARAHLPPLPLQCHLSGCMMDLFVQMAVIMGLKQTLSNCVEYLKP